MDELQGHGSHLQSDGAEGRSRTADTLIFSSGLATSGKPLSSQAASGHRSKQRFTEFLPVHGVSPVPAAMAGLRLLAAPVAAPESPDARTRLPLCHQGAVTAATGAPYPRHERRGT